MSLKKPALDPMSLAARNTSGYPEPYRSRVLPREKRALGDALGLRTVGINHTVLPPGKESSMRHWHTHERNSSSCSAAKWCWSPTWGNRC